jgi:UDP-N-acetylglucosamine 1-carboxyvinyltransferase
MIRLMFSRMGIETHPQNGDDLFVPAGQTMEIITDLGGAIPRIEDAPWPMFPADMTSVALVTATQCKGTILIHEKMFESRLYFTDPLIGMGARIVLCDPHRAVVIGPEKLRGSMLTSPDIRAGMAMLIAALCAEGESKILNIWQIDRGFMQIEKSLQKLGANIERVEG